MSDFWRLLPHQYPSFWAWDEGLALIPNPNPLFPRPAEIVQQADRYLKVVAFLEPTWNSLAPGWPLTVSVCKKLRTYIDGVAKSVMSELISPHRPDLSARIAICTRKKKLSSDARFGVTVTP